MYIEHRIVTDDRDFEEINNNMCDNDSRDWLNCTQCQASAATHAVHIIHRKRYSNSKTTLPIPAAGKGFSAKVCVHNWIYCN